MTMQWPGRAGVLAAVALLTTGCGTSPVDVSACKQIEEARCRHAPACGVSLEPPYSTSGGDVSACIRFYDLACLHGLAVPDPAPQAVSACVASIESSPCDGGMPLFETDPACDWLTGLPIADASAGAGPDADADAGQATADATGDGGPDVQTDSSLDAGADTTDE